MAPATIMQLWGHNGAGMVPLIVLVVTFLICFGTGVAGWLPFHQWRTALVAGLVLMFFTTASAHWGRLRSDLVRMVPPVFARREQVVTLTGILEVAGAIGLVFPATRRVAALSLVALLIAMVPANIYAAKKKLLLAGRPAMGLRERLLLQIVFVTCLIAIVI